jgi:hypothetical protein
VRWRLSARGVAGDGATFPTGSTSVAARLGPSNLEQGIRAIPLDLLPRLSTVFAIGFVDLFRGADAADPRSFRL